MSAGDRASYGDNKGFRQSRDYNRYNDGHGGQYGQTMDGQNQGIIIMAIKGIISAVTTSIRDRDQHRHRGDNHARTHYYPPNNSEQGNGNNSRKSNGGVKIDGYYQ